MSAAAVMMMLVSAIAVMMMLMLIFEIVFVIAQKLRHCRFDYFLRGKIFNLELTVGEYSEHAARIGIFCIILRVKMSSAAYICFNEAAVHAQIARKLIGDTLRVLFGKDKR